MLTNFKRLVGQAAAAAILPASLGVVILNFSSVAPAIVHLGQPAVKVDDGPGGSGYPLTPDAQRAFNNVIFDDGPGLGGGYITNDDGPGLGGGYITNDDGPGLGGGYITNDDGPGLGGGYITNDDGPGLGGGYITNDDDGPQNDGNTTVA